MAQGTGSLVVLVPPSSAFDLIAGPARVVVVLLSFHALIMFVRPQVQTSSSGAREHNERPVEWNARPGRLVGGLVGASKQFAHIMDAHNLLCAS